MAESSRANYQNAQYSLRKDFQRSYPGAFSASDIHALIKLPGGHVRALGNLAALSISTHRDSFPVTSISRVNPKGITQGHRTIAGTLIFHTLDRGAFGYGINPQVRQHAVSGKEHGSRPHPDSLPLFDIYITYTNDTGMASFEALYGVRLLDFGKTVSLENLHPMESYSYMALGYSPMHPIVSAEDVSKPTFLLQGLDRRKQTLRDGQGNLYPAVLLGDDLTDVVPAIQHNYFLNTED